MSTNRLFAANKDQDKPYINELLTSMVMVLKTKLDEEQIKLCRNETGQVDRLLETKPNKIDDVIANLNGIIGNITAKIENTNVSIEQYRSDIEKLPKSKLTGQSDQAVVGTLRDKIAELENLKDSLTPFVAILKQGHDQILTNIEMIKDVKQGLNRLIDGDKAIAKDCKDMVRDIRALPEQNLDLFVKKATKLIANQTFNMVGTRGKAGGESNEKLLDFMEERVKKIENTFAPEPPKARK
jgi:hypothetical protein